VGAPNVLRVAGLLPTSGPTVTHSELKADGSGSVSMVLDKWVAGRTYEIHRDSFLFRQFVDANKPAPGVRHLRCFAADYSGRSGAKALYVVADRLTGADERAAAFQLNVGRGRRPFQDGQEIKRPKAAGAVTELRPSEQSLATGGAPTDSRSRCFRSRGGPSRSSSRAPAAIPARSR
jgi:hypothetical protein